MVLILLTHVSCKEKTLKIYDVRIDSVSSDQKIIVQESGVKITEETPSYVLAKASEKQFDFLIEKGISVAVLSEMVNTNFANPTGLNDTNHAVYMEVYRNLWDFIGFKPHLSKKYNIQKVIASDSYDNIERWIDSFYSFMYEMDKKVVDEIRKAEQIKEASSLELSGPIRNSFNNIHSKEEFKKLIQTMNEPNLDKDINLTEKYFTGKNSSDIFVVVHLKTTRSELEVTIIDYRLVLSVIKK